MEFILEIIGILALMFLNGFLFSCGVVVFIILGLKFLYSSIPEKPQYELKPLTKAFEEYHVQLKQNEQFEKLKEVEQVLSSLYKGNIPNLKMWDIREKAVVNIQNEASGSPQLTINKRYTIKGKNEKRK